MARMVAAITEIMFFRIIHALCVAMLRTANKNFELPRCIETSDWQGVHDWKPSSGFRQSTFYYQEMLSGGHCPEASCRKTFRMLACTPWLSYQTRLHLSHEAAKMGNRNHCMHFVYFERAKCFYHPIEPVSAYSCAHVLRANTNLL